jgi:hypothetical protein
VHVRVTDSRGGVALVSATVTIRAVNHAPSAVLTLSPAPPYFAGLPITFSGASSTDPEGPGDIAQWRFDLDPELVGFEWPLGGEPGLSPTVTRSYPPGVHRVALRVIDREGNRDDTDFVEFTVLPSAPLATAAAVAAAATVTLPFTGTLTANPSGTPRIQRSGAVSRVRGLRARGRFDGKVGAVKSARARRAAAKLRSLLKAAWAGTLDAALDSARNTRTVSMRTTATLPKRRGKVCLRIRLTDTLGARPSGSFKVVGGTGAARRTSISGRFTFVPGKPGAIAGSAKVRPVKRLRACR